MIDKFQVAIIGAGPSGLFAAEKLAAEGMNVAVFNRDIKPGGMVEYGIFPDKHLLRQGLSRQFEQILANERILYFGNVSIGTKGCISIPDLRGWGFQAILVACGAQGTKWLKIPGEKLRGVYHAKDVVFHYNLLPPFSKEKLHLGKRVIIIGGGNVMTDIAHYLAKYRVVDEITILIRRGPAEVKFEKKELEPIINYFDVEDLDQEFMRVEPAVTFFGHSVEELKGRILSAKEKGCPPLSQTRIKMRFLLSPVEIKGNELQQVEGLVVENNALEDVGGEIHARGTGNVQTMQADSVIFAIGDKVDDELGLPVHHNGYRINPSPHYPVDGHSYEIECEHQSPGLSGVFIAGWARKPSTGLVGLAKKDGVNASIALMQYLTAVEDVRGIMKADLEKRIRNLVCQAVTKKDLQKLSENEKSQSQLRGVEYFKYATNEEMLNAIED